MRAEARDHRSGRQFWILVGIHGLALVGLFFFSWVNLAALAIGHILSACLGVSIGYHRTLAHRSVTFHPALRRLLAFLGTTAFQGGPLTWVSMHRAHHAKSDREGDPHSRTRGFWWSHMEWVYTKAPNGFRFRKLRDQAPDLATDPWLLFFEKHWLALNAALALVTLAVAGPGLFLWLFPLRIVAVWHCTFLVNSAAHTGVIDQQHGTSAINNPWVALVSYGEGWHLNHHLKPSSPTFQRRWFEIDPAYLVIRGFETVGLARRTGAASPIPALRKGLV